MLKAGKSFERQEPERFTHLPSFYSLSLPHQELFFFQEEITVSRRDQARGSPTLL